MSDISQVQSISKRKPDTYPNFISPVKGIFFGKKKKGHPEGISESMSIHLQ